MKTRSDNLSWAIASSCHMSAWAPACGPGVNFRLIMTDLMTFLSLISLCWSLHFNNTPVVMTKMRKRKKYVIEKERHKIKETDTLPCRQPMFLCVCSVEGKGQHRNEGQRKHCCAFVHWRTHNHMQLMTDLCKTKSKGLSNHKTNSQLQQSWTAAELVQLWMCLYLCYM